MCLLTSLPSYSPSHTGSQTQPADPPSGCISGRPSPRLHGNPGRTGAVHPSSGGTNSAAHNHSVSKGYQQQVVVILDQWPHWFSINNVEPLWTRMYQSNFLCLDSKGVIGVKGRLTFNIRPLAPALKLPVKRHTFTEKQLWKVLRYSNLE